MREDMFDRCAGLRFSPIGDPHAFRHGAALRLLAMDARDEAALCQHLLVLLRSISGVCPNGVCGVPLIQHIDETRAVESRSIARRPFAYQSMMTINRDMVLVAECWNGKIDLWHPTLFRLGLGYLIVQRASRSFWGSFAGLSFQPSGMRPCLIAFFSSPVLRCLGAATMAASMICPPMAR